MLHNLVLAFGLAAEVTPMPPAEQILDRYLEATGGKEAYSQIRSQISKATVEFVGQGISGRITSFVARPESMFTELDLGSLGKVYGGAKDGIVWELSSLQGARVLQGEEREQRLMTARLDAAVNWRERYTEVRVEAEEKVEGKVCYKVVAQPKDQTLPESSWYDRETGLLVKSKTTLKTAGGKIAMESVFGDYRKAGGILIPHKVTQRVGPQKIETAIDEVQTNVEIAEAQFNRPAEIEALLAKKKK